MKRNLLRLIVVLAVTAAICLALSACNLTSGGKDGAECEHVFGNLVIDTAPTCTEGGSGHATCERCGEVVTESIPKLGQHTPGAWITDVEPTCHTEGSKHNVCSVCGATVATATIGKIDHTPGSVSIEREPTCTEAGVQRIDCAVCGVLLSRSAVAVIEHTAAEWTVELPATCAAEGIMRQRCAVCAEIMGESVIPKSTVHTPSPAVSENFTGSTCSEGGSYDDVVYCSVAGCGRELSRTQMTIPPSEHTSSDWIVDEPATCVAEGARHKECTVCHIPLESDSIPMTATHVEGLAVTENRVEPTCSVPGSYESVVYCSVPGCGAELTRTPVPIPEKPHTPSAVITDRAPTCISEGLEYTECTVCFTRLTENTLPVLDHHEGGEAVYENAVASTCTKAGTHDEVVYCIWCSLELGRENKPAPKSAHTYEAGRCTACGVEENASLGLLFTSFGDGTCSVSGLGDCTDLAVIIPSVSPDGDRVIEIDAGAFRDKSITSVYIPDTITLIDVSAFSGCTALESINIPSSVTNVEPYAFSDCTALRECVGGVYYVDDWAVASDSSATSFSIREGTVGIAGYAFLNRYSLESVTLPGSLRYVMLGAFENCYKLTSVDIPEGVTEICENAFNNCYALASASLPRGLKIIGRNAFAKCFALAELDIPETVEVIGGGAFGDCSSLTEISLPDSVVSIGTGSFSGCTMATSVYIGSGLISVSDGAAKNPFSGSKLIEAITVSPKNTSFVSEGGNLYKFAGDGRVLVAYAPASSTTEFTVPEDVIGIYSNAASSAANLELLYVPGASANYILDFAFSRCTSLKAVVIGDGVERIGESAFANCTSLKEVSFGKNVEMIGNQAFYRAPLSSAVFASPSRWKYISYSNPANSGDFELSDISNPSTAARYLKSTYLYFTWYK